MNRQTLALMTLLAMNLGLGKSAMAQLSPGGCLQESSPSDSCPFPTVYPTNKQPFRRVFVLRTSRAPLPFDSVQIAPDARVRVTTPPDPRTGERQVVLDPLDWVHALARQVPDPRRHLVHYYGAYANRSRRLWQRRVIGVTWGTSGKRGESPGPGEDFGPPEIRPPDRPGGRTGSWAQLLRRILEVDPLLCPRCGIEMKVIAVIAEPVIVDRILHHRAEGRNRDPFDQRAPPSPGAAA